VPLRLAAARPFLFCSCWRLPWPCGSPRAVVDSAGLGVENLVAFMAAHRTAMNESRAVFDQSEIARIQVKAPLREVPETDGNSHRNFWMEWISQNRL
jgi:hypothetical protein